jgi:DNA-binding response OmpR family regulator
MNTSTGPRRVIVADDDEEMRAAVAAALNADGWTTVEACDGEELLDLIRISLGAHWLRPDVVVADVRMPKLSGLGVLQALKRANWRLPFILITAVSDESIDMLANRLGAVDVLRKPIEVGVLVNAIRNAALPSTLHG